MPRRYLRALRLPGSGAAALLTLAPGPGLLAAFSAADLALNVFDVNGAPLVRAEVTERLAAMAASPCGRFLVTGGARGAATLLWLHSLEVGAGSGAPGCNNLFTRLGTFVSLLAAAAVCDSSGGRVFRGLGHAAALGERQLVHPGMWPWLSPFSMSAPVTGFVLLMAGRYAIRGRLRAGHRAVRHGRAVHRGWHSVRRAPGVCAGPAPPPHGTPTLHTLQVILPVHTLEYALLLNCLD